MLMHDFRRWKSALPAILLGGATPQHLRCHVLDLGWKRLPLRQTFSLHEIPALTKCDKPYAVPSPGVEITTASASKAEPERFRHCSMFISPSRLTAPMKTY